MARVEVMEAASASSADLNLLLEWPKGRTRPEWAAIFAASIVIHIVVFMAWVQVPSLVGQRRVPEPEPVQHRVKLYLPPDVLTQRAPNKAPITKQIDLASLQEAGQARRAVGRARQAAQRQERAKVTIPQPPSLPPTPPVARSPQILAGLPPAPAPAPQPKVAANAGPFQNIPEPPTPTANPKLVPPSANLGAPPSPGTSSAPGTLSSGSGEAESSAVELESDPNGADFKIYLRTILGIVRANWKRVIPPSARAGALRGKTVIEFIISRDGSIPKLVTAVSSGSDPLDRAAVVGLSMSNPLPPLPTDFRGSQVRLAFTFAYNEGTQ